MQTNTFSSTSFTTVSETADQKVLLSAPVELDLMALLHVGGGLGPAGTWAEAATDGPAGTW